MSAFSKLLISTLGGSYGTEKVNHDFKFEYCYNCKEKTKQFLDWRLKKSDGIMYCCKCEEHLN
jgi:hypothetical protein